MSLRALPWMMLLAGLVPAGRAGADPPPVTAAGGRLAVDDDDDVPLHLPPSWVRPAAGPSSAAVEQGAVARPAVPDHVAPFLKLAYRHFEVKNLDSVGAVQLNGVQLDMYPVSRRWFRLALEFEAGGGSATLETASATLATIHSGVWYAISGASVGFQYPARFTPFLDARFAAGLLGLSFNDTLGASHGAFSYMYLGGLDVGVEVFIVGRGYLSLAIGWAHPVYRGVDYKLAINNPTAELQFLDFGSDSFTFKLGLGL